GGWGGGGAGGVEGEGEEGLVGGWELDPRRGGDDPEAIAERVRGAVAEECEAAVEEVLLVAPGAVPKTSSGKVQRHACRAAYLAASWEPLARSTALDATADPIPEPEESAEDERARLAGLPSAEREAALLAALRREAARAARAPVSRIAEGASLAAAGIDSLGAVEIQGRLEERLGLAIPLADLLGAGSLAEIAREQAPRWEGAEGAAGPHGDDALEVGVETGAEQPLSARQRALWFLHRLAPESAAYHLAAALRLQAPFDAAALARTFAALALRHPALRTTFGATDGEPWQRVHPRLDGGWSETSAAGWTDGELT